MANKEFLNVGEKEKEELARKEFLKYMEKVKRTTLSINRIPEQYKTRFMEIANNEFSKDYGLCLRELIRTWDGIFVSPNEELLAKIEILSKEVEDLKKDLISLSEDREEDKSVTIMADGKTKR